MGDERLTREHNDRRMPAFRTADDIGRQRFHAGRVVVYSGGLLKRRLL